MTHSTIIHSETLLLCSFTLSQSCCCCCFFFFPALSIYIKYIKFKTLTSNGFSFVVIEKVILELGFSTIVAMAEEKDAFYVVKKGDVVGIYKSFSDIQPLLVSGESLSIYKGFSLPQKTEEYLVSHGLKGATYSISAADVHEGLFGKLVACPYQDPCSSGRRPLVVYYSSKSSQDATQSDANDPCSSGRRPLVVYYSSKSSQDATQSDANDPYSSGRRPLVVNCSSKNSQGATQFDANDPYSAGRRPLVVNCSSKSSQGATQFDANHPCSSGRRPLVVYYSSKSSQDATQFDANDPYSSGRRPLVVNCSSKSSQGATQFDANDPCSSGRRPLVVYYSSKSSQDATQSDANDPYSSGRRPLVVNCSSKSSQGATQFDANDPYSSGRRPLVVNCSSKSSQGATQFDANEAGACSFSTNLQRHHVINGFEAELSTCISCILEFDGASKGNPGPAGAGAILRPEDGSKVYRLREGVGTQTNNVAEYRALILGLKHAIKKGYKHIHAQGDSLLVCNQIQGLWKIKNQNLGYLCNEAKELKDKFLSFRINHVPREYNTEADVQANLAINLQAGQVEEDWQHGSCLLLLASENSGAL